MRELASQRRVRTPLHDNKSVPDCNLCPRIRYFEHMNIPKAHESRMGSKMLRQVVYPTMGFLMMLTVLSSCSKKDDDKGAAPASEKETSGTTKPTKASVGPVVTLAGVASKPRAVRAVSSV